MRKQSTGMESSILTMARDILLIASIMCISSCEYIQSLTDPGDYRIEQFHISSVNQVVVDAPYRIVLKNAPVTSLEVEGYSEMTDGFSYQSDQGILILKNKNANTIPKNRMPIIRLSAPEITSIKCNAPCILSSVDTLRTETLTLIVNGRGTYTDSDLTIDCTSFFLFVYGEINAGIHQISGKSVSASFLMEGCTYAFAKGLKCKEVNFTQRSAANCEVTATEQLNATIFSTGDIICYGQPVVLFERGESSLLSSTGKVITHP